MLIDVKPGIVSMAHSWGGSPDPAAGADAQVRELGSNTNRLIENNNKREKYSAMVQLSTIPVRIQKTE